LFGVESFLRQHYTASRESAAAIASYLRAAGEAPAGAKKGTPTKRAKGEGKGDAKKKADAPVTLPGDNKPADASSSPKPSEPAAAPAEAKPAETKPAESKPAETPKAE
jgi:hypothetical protein